MRKSRLIAGLIVTALALAGCSTGTPQPSPSGTGTNGTSQGSTDPSGPASALALLDPCTLINDQEARTVHLIKIGPEKPVIGTGSQCAWHSDTNLVDVYDIYSLDFEIQPQKGLSYYNTRGFQLKQVTYKNHKGEQFYAGVDVCSETIVITDSSSVSVTVSASPATACSLANDFATLIDPKLPLG